MAQNPFYVGYFPEQTDLGGTNPFAIGYFPGRKTGKRFIESSGAQISSVGGFGTTDIIDAYIDDLTETLGNNLNLPKWVLERMGDDTKTTLKINSLPPKGVTETALDEYDVNSTYGAGFIQLDIDPRAWAKNGVQKMVQKTLWGWTKSIYNASDLENKARENYWKTLLNSPEIGGKDTFAGRPEWIVAIVVKNENERIDRENEIRKERNKIIREENDRAGERNARINEENLRRIQNGEESLPLENINSELRMLNHVDTGTGGVVRGAKNPFWIDPTSSSGAYKGVGSKVADFFAKARSPLFRDTAYDDASRDVLKALSKELKDAGMGDVGLTHVDSFRARVGFSYSLGDIGKKRIETTTALEKIILGNQNLDAISDLQDRLSEITENVTSIKKSLGDETLRGFLIESHGESFVNDLENRLNLLEEVTKSQDFQDLLAGRFSLTGATRLKKSLSLSPGKEGIVIGKDFKGGDFFAPSFEREMMNRLLGEIVDPNHEMHIMLASGNLEARKLLLFLPRMMHERQMEAMNEVWQKMQKGFAETYVWTNRFGKFTQAGFQYYSPSDLLKLGLAQIQNFGLVINENNLKNWNFYQRAINNYKSAPNVIFGNRFKVDVEGQKLTLWGGKHFEAAAVLKNMMDKNPETAGMAQQLIQMFFVDGRGANETKEEFEKRVKELLKKIYEDKKSVKEIDEVYEKLQSFREYVNVNILKPWGVNNTSEFWQKLSIKLGGEEGEFLSVTRRYLGLMEKISKLIRKAQDTLYFKIPLISPAIQYISSKVFEVKEFVRIRAFNIKQVATEKLMNSAFGKALERGLTKTIQATSAAIKKLAETWLIKLGSKIGLQTLLNTIAQSIGSLVPIVGNIIGAVVSWIIDKVLNKILEKVKDVLKGLKHAFTADFDAMLQDFEKKFDKNIKKFLFVLVTIVMIFAFFGTIISSFFSMFGTVGDVAFPDPLDDPFTYILATFSPTDPSRKYGSIRQDFDWNITLGLDANGMPIGGGGTGSGDGGGTGGECDLNGCTGLPEKILPPKASENSVTARAYVIAQDLERGFWCLFNHSPNLYPGLWDDALFAADPCLTSYDKNNPDMIDALFHCTWLVIYSQRALYPDFPANTGTCTMLEGLRADSRYTLVRRADIAAASIPRGSIIIYGHSDFDLRTSGCADHVGIVYSTSNYGIHTIESNAYNTSVFIPTECVGPTCSVTNSMTFTVVGFALLN